MLIFFIKFHFFKTKFQALPNPNYKIGSWGILILQAYSKYLYKIFFSERCIPIQIEFSPYQRGRTSCLQYIIFKPFYSPLPHFLSFCPHFLRDHLKELSFCHKLSCSYHFIFAACWCKPLIFQTQTIWSNKVNSLKYQKSKRIGC